MHTNYLNINRQHYRSVFILLLIFSLNFLSAGEIRLVNTFETWPGLRSTDPSGITYNPKSGTLILSDSEINEITDIWSCENIFEVSLDGSQLFNTFDSYDDDGVPCNESDPNSTSASREPAGITYNEFDGFFYVADDEEHAIIRYNDTFDAPVAWLNILDTDENNRKPDLEGITSDPRTGFLYVVLGDQNEVRIYNSNLDPTPISTFSIGGIATDPEGIAFNAERNDLMIVSSTDNKIYEFTVDGLLVDEYSIINFVPIPISAQGLTFAPTSDPNDHPEKLSLYISDAQEDNDDNPLERDGIIYEAEIVNDFVFIADSKIKIDKQLDCKSNIHSNGNLELKKGPGIFIANLTATGAIMIDKDNSIIGNVTAGGKVDIKKNSQVTGNINEYSDVALIPLPTLSFVAGGDKITVKKNERVKLKPGSYGDVKVEKDGILILNSGQYYMNKLELKKNAVIHIDIKNNSVGINIVDKLSFDKNSVVEVTGNNSRMVTFNSLHNKIEIKDNSVVLGNIIAPEAEVKLNKNVLFKGKIYADKIFVSKYVNFQTHNSALSNSIAGENKSIEKYRIANNKLLKSLEHNDAHKKFGLDKNYPNPFNPSTRIRYSIPESGEISLKIFNLNGQLIKTLLSGYVESGWHEVVWDGRNEYGSSVSSGTYLYSIQAGKFIESRKMFLLK